MPQEKTKKKEEILHKARAQSRGMHHHPPIHIMMMHLPRTHLPSICVVN